MVIRVSLPKFEMMVWLSLLATTISSFNVALTISSLDIIRFDLNGFIKLLFKISILSTLFFDKEFNNLRVFNGFPEKYHKEDTLDTIDATRNYLKGKNIDDIVEDVLKIFE